MIIFKNTNAFLISSIICAATLISCNKDDTEVNEQTSVEVRDGLKIVNYSRSNGSNTTGRTNSFSGTAIAVFNNEQSYNNYTEQLEAEVESWDDAFVTQWGHLNEDQLNEKEDELNFDSEKPLTDFENETGLVSLRQKYLQEEDNWLSNEVLDIENHPDNKPVYDFDESEMTLLNHLAEVQIGTTIIKKLNQNQIEFLNSEATRQIMAGRDIPFNDVGPGDHIVIGEEDYDALIDFNNGDYSIIYNDNVGISSGNATTTCSFRKFESEDFSISSDKFIMTKIKVRGPSLGWNGKIKAKIKSYKDGFFGWRRWRTNIAAGAKGNVYNENCNNTPTNINNWTSTKKRKKRVYKWRNSSFESHKVENGGMTGMFRHNNIVKELILTW